MAHRITTRRGGIAEAAYALTPAWHGLGTVLDYPMSSREALAAAHLDWTVEQCSLFHNIPGSTTASKRIPLLANVRSDTWEFLGAVSKDYHVVQNAEAFDFLDQLIAEKQMTYESAFSLDNGKRVVLLARLPQEDIIVGEDRTLRYILLSLSHDGASAIRFGPCSERVVCANTYAVALGEGAVDHLSISHTGRIKDKLEAARHILSRANRKFDGKPPCRGNCWANASRSRTGKPTWTFSVRC